MLFNEIFIECNSELRPILINFSSQFRSMNVFTKCSKSQKSYKLEKSSQMVGCFIRLFPSKSLLESFCIKRSSIPKDVCKRWVPICTVGEILIVYIVFFFVKRWLYSSYYLIVRACLIWKIWQFCIFCRFWDGFSISHFSCFQTECYYQIWFNVCNEILYLNKNSVDTCFTLAM